ncbi:uncharacterized protein [Typha angustifolia]|uniref:uncharacterized protein n=1 Tax=Typha angustifolia TaxID=59011 RepID=UPI003C2BAC7F
MTNQERGNLYNNVKNALESFIFTSTKLSKPILQTFGPLSVPITIDEDDLKNLRSKHNRIRATLKGAETLAVADESVKLWLRELRDIELSVEDILEEIEFESLRANQLEDFKVELLLGTDGKRKREAGSLFLPSPLSDLNRKIINIRERYHELAFDRNALRLRKGDGKSLVDVKPRTPSSSLATGDCHGREEDLRKVLELVFSDSRNGRSYGVITVVGIAGVGKTTLVQYVCNDERVRSHFHHPPIWIWASQDFNVVDMTRTMIQACGGDAREVTELSLLQENLVRLLSGKKFLLVLDEVWSVDKESWERLQAPFNCAGNGSKVIVTSQNLKVAKIMGSGCGYHLSCLSDESCWLICQKQAFDGQNRDALAVLEPIGKEIAKKCKGVPLVAKVAGGLLRSSIDEEHWNDVLQSDLWTNDEVVNEVMAALRLSYDHLPFYLKRCFAYCSLFPKDHIFEKEQLVRLWMGQGFLEPNERLKPGDIGENYFNELVERCLFQQNDQSEGRYVMHDLFHELAESIAGNECFRTEDYGLRNIHEEARHSSLVPSHSEIEQTIGCDSFDGGALRTFLFIGRLNHGLFYVKIPDILFTVLKCLRALDLSNTSIEELPSSIGNLIHLRYLSLVNTKIRRLPESICCLVNLQCLNLKNCNELIELPQGIKLLKLRHLELPQQEYKDICMSYGIGELTDRQTFPTFDVGSGIASCESSSFPSMLILPKALDQATSRYNSLDDTLARANACLHSSQASNVPIVFMNIQTEAQLMTKVITFNLGIPHDWEPGTSVGIGGTASATVNSEGSSTFSTPLRPEKCLWRLGFKKATYAILLGPTHEAWNATSVAGKKEMEHARIPSPSKSSAQPLMSGKVRGKSPSLPGMSRHSFGRGDDMEHIIELILSDDCRGRYVSFVRVVGASGLGKTTLVSLAYHDTWVCEYFDAKGWVFLSAERCNHMGVLLRAIIECFTGVSCGGLTDLDQLREILEEELTGKRFLLVLDNAFNEDPNFWSDLLPPLSAGAKGSVVVVTTRTELVANIEGLNHSHQLNPLEDHICWRIIKSNWFLRPEILNDAPNLVGIGERIAAKCKGVPLLAKVVSGTLGRGIVSDEQWWDAVLQSDLWDMSRQEVNMLPALRMGYNHLTQSLKQCFMYCSLFPKGYIFEKDYLIRLWLSQGFIDAPGLGGRHRSYVSFFGLLHGGGREYGANKYFDDLLRMQFFQCSPLHTFEEGKFVMHELLCDLVRSVSGDAFLRAEDYKLSSEISEDVRHLSFSPTLPDSIEYLESLQFLGLNNTNIRKIPDSICRLSNLETLELRNCCCLCDLPNGIKDLVNLRHLDVWKETGVIRTPLGIGRLTNLQTLGTFSVGELCKLSELKNLNGLRGHLRIGCLENVGRGIDARSAFLKDIWDLKKLTLQWNRGEEKLEGIERVTTAGEVLENIRPHESLEELIIRDYCGLKFPTWLANPFSELASVTLVNCYGCHELPNLGRLGNLQYLFMQNVNGLRHVASDLGGAYAWRFPSLKSLKLWEMYELEGWNDVNETDFPRLESVSISRCPRLRSLPSFISLVELSVHCCGQFPFPDLQSLRTLKIEGLQNLTSLALPSTLDALETLEIQSCNKISSVDGLQLLNSLKKLKLKNCPELSFSQDARLPDALQVVDIHCSCSSLKNWCPYGFEDISGAHNQVSRKLVR